MTKAEWKEWKEEHDGDIWALKSLADDEGLYCCLDNLISEDMVDDFVRERLENSGWQGVACCISDIIENMNDDWYEIDGYGNLRTAGSWDDLADELEREMSFDLPTCDRCGCEYEEEELHTVIDWFSLKEGSIKLSAETINDIIDGCGEDICCEDCFNEIIEDNQEDESEE